MKISRKCLLCVTVVMFLVFIIFMVIITTSDSSETYSLKTQCYNAKTKNIESVQSTISCQSLGCHMLDKEPKEIDKRTTCCDRSRKTGLVDTNGMSCECAFPGVYKTWRGGGECKDVEITGRINDLRSVDFPNCSQLQYDTWNKRKKVRDLLQTMLKEGKWPDAFATNLNFSKTEKPAIQKIVDNVKNMLDLEERAINQNCPPRYCLWAEDNQGSWGYDQCQHQPPDWYDPKVHVWKQYGDPIRIRRFSTERLSLVNPW